MTDVPLGVTVAVLLAAGLDWTLREPPAEYHPVTLFGRLVDSVDAEYDDPKRAGVAVAAILPIAAAVAVYAALWLTTPLPGIVTAVLAGLVLWSTSSLRLLIDAAEQAIEESETDPEAAREVLPALVGRDTADLPPELLRSAAVESAAENFSDGFLAPILAFALFALVSLPAAAAAATYVKCVNTLDSMLGYPGPFGWASARLDDFVMFVPARLSSVVLGLAAGDPDAPGRARRYASVPDSPNAGWPMGSVAAAHNLRLEKPETYVLNEVADFPTVAEGHNAIRTVTRAGIATYVIVALLGVILWL
ncbi:cobalamin biosynthesis protein [Natronomonas gomsonensis]|uniref:CobD/CbiB family cobalamin biosynthesis protein n=1 Tax=Natronomonas gomsonensis TaxID=1046043 RepID=UPI0020CA3F7E|nr:CobD/CbiB family cobalamin biosynthesis protein [Natronomonas gomsonensis]MCY4730782.1 cobalamin biosynthesis protein [Natronomonas gomsonensis]